LTLEVTRKEILDKYMVQSSGIATTGWTKYITLHTGKANGDYTGRLYWDSNDGYRMYWDDDKMPEEAYRPEFEYILDSITEGSNANN
jgi:hypothetical protein